MSQVVIGTAGETLPAAPTGADDQPAASHARRWVTRVGARPSAVEPGARAPRPVRRTRSSGCQSKRAERQSARSGPSRQDRRAARPGTNSPASATADQLGQAMTHDRLAAEAQSAEVARESDALKSALLQSVSHDLRTPLATIRAAAGTLRPGTAADDVARVRAWPPSTARSIPQPLGQQPAGPEPYRRRSATGEQRHLRARRSRPGHLVRLAHVSRAGRCRWPVRRAGRGRSGLLRCRPCERDRERHSPHAAGHDDPHQRCGGRPVAYPPDDRGLGPGRARRAGRAPVR